MNTLQSTSVIRPGAAALGLALGIAALLGAPSAGAAASDPAIAWELSTNMPECRDGYGAGVIDGKLIIVGGIYWEGSKENWIKKVFSGSTHSFDPRTGKWEKLADAPVTFGYPASAQVGDEIFVMGGNQNGKPSREVYVTHRVDGVLRTERHSELPEPRLFGSAVTVGTKIYLIGGALQYEPFDTKGTCCTSRTARTSVWVLDTTDPMRTWKVLPNYPGEARWLQTAAAVGPDVYVFGGICSYEKDQPMRKFNDVLHYDTVAGAWNRVSDLPETLQSAAAVNIGGRIVLIGTKNHVAQFDPATGKIVELNPLPRDAMVSRFLVIDSLLVGAGGENTLDGPRRRSEWTFIGRPTAALSSMDGK